MKLKQFLENLGISEYEGIASLSDEHRNMEVVMIFQCGSTDEAIDIDQEINFVEFDYENNRVKVI